MRIPGIPGASEPSFRTRARGLMGFDSMVHETCAVLRADGLAVGPVTAKAAIQVARRLVDTDSEIAGPELFERVSLRLRHMRVLLVPRYVEAVLLAYGRVVVDMDIAEVFELGV